MYDDEGVNGCPLVMQSSSNKLSTSESASVKI